MRIFIFLVSLLCSEVHAGIINYEIIDYKDNPKGTVIASGQIQQKISDVKIIKTDGVTMTLWSKSVMLEKNFRIGFSDSKDTKLTGFGMWAKKDDDSFSWDWFNQKSKDQFVKLQEGGIIKVRTVGGPAIQEIAEIEFISDISLRISSFSSGNTEVLQRVNIKKGSIFSVLP